MINQQYKKRLNGNKIAAFILTLIIILLIGCRACNAQSYYTVEVTYQLTDGSEQGTSIQQIVEPNYSSVLADLKKYVSPYKVKPYSLQLDIVKKPGVIPLGNGSKFKPNKKPKEIMREWVTGTIGTQYSATIEIPKPAPIKHDSTVSSPDHKKRLQEFLWIDYPKPGYLFYTVKFKKSSVTFINDTTFTYVDKFR